MRHLCQTLGVSCLAWLATMGTVVNAQTDRALDRRIDRNARQMQRQANQAEYYTNQVWQQIDPWVQQYEIAPLSKAANAVRNAANTAGNAVAQTADATSRRVDGQFGYRDQSQANTWFYDYYTYNPTYYTGQADDLYAGVIRYFDADNDGIYDSYSYYRDSDNDGRYDEYDKINFYSSQQPKQTNTSDRTAEMKKAGADDYQGPEDARRYKISGEITMLKAVTVNDEKHLMAGVKTDRVDMLAVDMGPAQELKDNRVEIGQTIVAIGAIENVGEKDVLVAESVQLASGETIQVNQYSGMTLTGEIIDVKSTPIGNVDHYFVVVNVAGERQLVDLGPTSTYKVKLEPSTQITVRGIPVRAHDHRVIMADRVQFGDELIRVERTQTFKF